MNLDAEIDIAHQPPRLKRTLVVELCSSRQFYSFTGGMLVKADPIVNSKVVWFSVPGHWRRWTGAKTVRGGISIKTLRTLSLCRLGSHDE